MRQHNNWNRLALGVIVLILAALACDVPPDIDTPPVNDNEPTPLPPTPEPTTPEGPTLTPFVDTPPLTYFSLWNATYTLGDPGAGGGTYTLETGSFEDAATTTHVELSQVMSFGDLNGDGAVDAVAILRQNTGGSGTFVYMSPVLNQGGLPHSVTGVGLGDRSLVHSIRIGEGGLITVDMTAVGPNDPFCCPTLQTRQTFQMSGEALSFVSEESPINRLTVDALQNATYVIEGNSYTLMDGIYRETGDFPMSVTYRGVEGFGDLNADGVEDAAVIVVLDGGGTGKFPYLAAMINEGGTPTNISSVGLGDREIIHDILIGDDGVITIEATAHGPNDPGCCPATYMVWHYKLEGGVLVSLD